MIEEGLRVIYDPARTAAMWLWGNVKRIPAHRRALKACEKDWERERPDVVVTIDYQAFHLFVGARARGRTGSPSSTASARSSGRAATTRSSRSAAPTATSS